jgi:membrane protease YdiL (CAAX protease family)
VDILGQAAIFGLLHGYQGWKSMALVVVLGAIFGTVASLRPGLRANMIAHSPMDALAAF